MPSKLITASLGVAVVVAGAVAVLTNPSFHSSADGNRSDMIVIKGQALLPIGVRASDGDRPNVVCGTQNGAEMDLLSDRSGFTFTCRDKRKNLIKDRQDRTGTVEAKLNVRLPDQQRTYQFTGIGTYPLSTLKRRQKITLSSPISLTSQSAIPSPSLPKVTISKITPASAPIHHTFTIQAVPGEGFVARSDDERRNSVRIRSKGNTHEGAWRNAWISTGSSTSLTVDICKDFAPLCDETFPPGEYEIQVEVYRDLDKGILSNILTYRITS